MTLDASVVIDYKKQAVQTVIDKLSKGSDNIELYLNINYLANELYSNKKNLFTTFFMHDHVYETLLANIEDQDDFKVISTLKLLSTLLGNLKHNFTNTQAKKEQFFDEPEEDDVVVDSEEKPTEAAPPQISEHVFIKMIYDKIPAFIHFLEIATSGRLESTIGEEVRTLGAKRL